jgi:hypothetical protein
LQTSHWQEKKKQATTGYNKKKRNQEITYVAVTRPVRDQLPIDPVSTLFHLGGDAAVYDWLAATLPDASGAVRV